ncbi:MAG: AI-2E family transporter [Candidatus Symbiodolus clandestinus]
MFEMLQRCYQRHFSNPSLSALTILLLLGVASLYFFSSLLAPFCTALILAYLLEWPIALLQRFSIPRGVAVLTVLVLSLSLLALLFLGLLPQLGQQGIHLLHDLPRMLSSLHNFVLTRPYYTTLVEFGIIDTVTSQLPTKLLTLGSSLVKHSVISLLTIIKLSVYLILMPLMLFFMLKDKQQLLLSAQQLLPKHRQLINAVWQMVNRQVARYIGGKLLEMLLVTLATYGLFALFQLHYALLLSIPVGISVLIPYVGVLLATLPVASVALFQWGLSSHCGYFMGLYMVIQILDANLLVPLLFSEALKLHPLVIILASLFFGSLWGFWGLFFAIPLAILLKALFSVWLAESAR